MLSKYWRVAWFSMNSTRIAWFAAAAATAAKSLQSCLILCDPRDGSPPGSPIPGILQARTLACLAWFKWGNSQKGKNKSFACLLWPQEERLAENKQKQIFTTGI